MGSQVISSDRVAARTLSAGAALALLWSGVSWHSYTAVLSTQWLHVSLRDAIANGLLTVFFLAIGFEISRDGSEGALRDWRHAVRPSLAALGGMAGTAGIALLIGVLAPSHALVVGWGVPMATDIAFVVGVSAFLPALPRELRVFLLTLAVVDDIGSLAVLGLTTTHHVRILGLLGAAVIIATGWRLRGTARPTLVVLLVAPLWCALWFARVEPALAGVIGGALLPMSASHQRLERRTTALSHWIVLPMFAMSACGIWWHNIGSSSAPWTLAGFVVAARVIGKIVGIGAGLALATHLGAPPSSRYGPRVVIGLGALCAMGFTVPLIFAASAFGNLSPTYSALSLGLDVATVFGGVLGVVVLRRVV